MNILKIMKKLTDLGLPITEEQYRNDGCMHYSTLSRYTRNGGFKNIHTLFDKIESPSLVLGSCTDVIMTDGMDAFNEQFIVSEFPSIPDTIVSIVKALFGVYKSSYNDLNNIPNNIIIATAEQFNYQSNWKPETRAKVIKEKGSEYYRLMYIAEGKTIISNKVYSEALGMCDALKNSPATSFFFAPNNPFDNSIERVYQPKFKATFDGIDYSCMCDGMVALHDKKKIIAFDLKTSHNKEFDFFHSFLDFNYHYQARQYYRIVRDAMDKDDYFKDFELTNWYFIVVNKDSKTPLVWEYPDTKKYGTLYYGKNNQIECKDPFDVAKELKYYLDNQCVVPKDIYTDKPNNLIEHLNRL